MIKEETYCYLPFLKPLLLQSFWHCPTQKPKLAFEVEVSSFKSPLHNESSRALSGLTPIHIKVTSKSIISFLGRAKYVSLKDKWTFKCQFYKLIRSWPIILTIKVPDSQVLFKSFLKCFCYSLQHFYTLPLVCAPPSHPYIIIKNYTNAYNMDICVFVCLHISPCLAVFIWLKLQPWLKPALWLLCVYQHS